MFRACVIPAHYAGPKVPVHCFAENCWASSRVIPADMIAAEAAMNVSENNCASTSVLCTNDSWASFRTLFLSRPHVPTHLTVATSLAGRR